LGAWTPELIVAEAFPFRDTVVGKPGHLAPEGSPEQLTVTEPLKPFCGVSVSTNGLVPGAIAVIVEGLAVRTKTAFTAKLWVTDGAGE
jgi:hypothetical protein